jgi:hypothetical protein
MADIRFGAYSKAYYGDVVKAERPRSTGLTLVPIHRSSGKPIVDTDVGYYGNKPGDIVERLYKDGQYAQGLINNKLYENGVEVSPEQAQAGHTFNYSDIKGELATLGIRTPVGTGGSQFVRDPAAEKKLAEAVRANLKAGREWNQNTAFSAASGFYMPDRPGFKEALAAASDEEIIGFVGGVNKEGVIGAGYGINAVYDVYSSNVSTPGGKGYGTGEYGGTGPTPYARGSRAITESDILALAKISSNPGDPQQGNANKQLIFIFENDPSWLRREQARDAMSYATPGSPDYDRAMATKATGSARDMAYTASDGRQFSSPDAYTTYQANLDSQKAERKSAYDLLYQQFAKYGLQSLVTPLEGLIKEGIPASEFAIRLRETDGYKQRFAANQARIKKGLSALSEAEYIGLEDAYQGIMRQYGMPESYYTRGELGRQEGFEKFIGGDVSPAELETRISTAYNRVINTNPEVVQALKQYYPNITNGDILSYALDPDKALTDINKKITAAEIGAGAMQAGLTTGLARAEELQRYGVTKETAQQGFGTIASGLERGRQLSNIYQQPEYTQQVAETEVFALPDAEKARRQRRKLGQLETATFSGTTGMTGGALDRERAGQY